jgi:cyclophilin family peptidyl-prolyl cis-trans isomerase
MHFLRLAQTLILFSALTTLMRGQVTTAVPTVAQPIGTQTLVAGGPAVTLDLRNFIIVPGVTGEVVQFESAFGAFNVQMRADAAPRHVTNFLGYARDGVYANTFLHRSATFDGGATSILQGGGYRVVGEALGEVPRRAPVALEYNLPNARGTLAAARTADPNSATSEWYFNTRDNSTNLNQSNGGGYTVFGQVLGSGMNVLDAMAALPRVNVLDTPFTELPVRNYTPGGSVSLANLVVFSAITPVTLYPTGGGPSVVAFSVEHPSPGTVATLLSGSTLTLTPLAGGSTTVTVRGVDTNGNAAQLSFAVNVGAVMPVFLFQPASQEVAVGSTVVLEASARGATSYQWRHDGEEIVGATTASLVIRNVTAANTGTYSSTALNSIGSVSSAPATLTVSNVPEPEVGRLANLSVLTSAGAADRVLTVGAVIGPATLRGAALPLVVRAVGPTLTGFGVGGVLADPVMTLLAAGVNQPLGSNDDWGGGADLAAAFAGVGAFELPSASRDAAIVRLAPGLSVGDYTVQVSGKGDAQGMVLAEMYDAAGIQRTGTTPRLINLSVLKQLEAGETMTAGFVLQGRTARTVLIRAIGPGLQVFGVGNPMADPTLALFSGQTKIAENDNWGGELHLSSLGDAVGAFRVTNAFSADAMLALTLAPGNYTAQVSGVSGGGNVIVEVYEVR